MLEISILAPVAAIVAGIVLTGLLVCVPAGGVSRSVKRQPRSTIIGAGLILLFLMLSACSGPTTSDSTPPTITPLALTPTPTPTLKATATATTPTTASTDWTTYHRDNQRTGSVATTPDPKDLAKNWDKQLDGAVYAEPLVVGKRVIVATEGDSLYSLDPTTGNVQWHTNVGTPVPLNTLPCGDIDPLGITGTPAYDSSTGLVYAVAEVSGPAHILVGIDVNTGQVKVRRNVDTDGMDPVAHQERGALIIANGMVYVPYGGLDGDCADYIGRVVASQVDGQGALKVYRVPTTREGGIWTPPGPSTDAAGNIYVAVGNGAVTSGNWDHSDSILRLSPSLQLQDGFAPTSWGDENANDLDMGSQGPTLLPNNYIFAAGKSGKAYVLHMNTLGGVGGQVDVRDFCTSFSGTATVGSTIYVPCQSGVRQVTVDSTGHMHLGWQADGSITGSPVVGGHTVYSLSNRSLYALNADSGRVIVSISVGQTNRFATPTISGSTIYVGTLNGITSVAIK